MGRRSKNSGLVQNTTNNCIGLTAVIEVLKRAKGPRHLIIHTDSEYVLLGTTERLPGLEGRRMADEEWRRDVEP
jgi:ribonuclease HI